MVGVCCGEGNGSEVVIWKRVVDGGVVYIFLFNEVVKICFWDNNLIVIGIFWIVCLLDGNVGVWIRIEGELFSVGIIGLDFVVVGVGVVVVVSGINRNRVVVLLI